MAHLTRNVGMFLMAALWVCAATAQDMTSNWDDELPPQVSLPTPGMQSDVGTSGDIMQDPSMMIGPAPSADAPFEGYNEYSDFHGHVPAPIESTGTWLRRGFWYLETDAVVWNRMWNRDDKLFAADDPQMQDPGFFSPFNPTRQLITNRLMFLQSAHPGEDGSVRATLGNFLFRDSKNRDHTMEFTAFGGGDWQQQPVISSAQPFGLFVPFYIDGNLSNQQGTIIGNKSFDESSFQSIDYKSDYASFEFNYRVKQRLGRDRLKLDPNGCWHRDANPGFEREFLAGLRFMELGETLDWRAEDIQEGTSQDLGNDGR